MSDIELEAAELIEIIEYNASISDVIDWLQKRDARQAPASGEVDLDEDYPNFCIVSFGHKGYELKHEVFTDVESAAIRANELESKGFGIVRRQSAFTHPPAKAPEGLTEEMLNKVWKAGFDAEHIDDREYCQELIILRNAVEDAAATTAGAGLPDELLSEKGILVDLLRDAALAERKVDTCYDEPNKNPRLANALNWLADFVARGFKYPPQEQ